MQETVTVDAAASTQLAVLGLQRRQAGDIIMRSAQCTPVAAWQRTAERSMAVHSRAGLSAPQQGMALNSTGH